jgi:hypothetical protein
MLKSTFCAAIAAVLVVLPCSSLLAQNAPPAHPPRPKMLGPAKWQPVAREISAAYWTLEPGWSTTLEMRNNVMHHDLSVTPVLRSETGQETSLPPVTIPSQHVISINLRNAAALNHANLGSFGSVAFRFNGLNASNLFAATIVRREGEPIDFHFDGQDSGTKYDLGGFEGLWWIPAASSTDYLILLNPAKKSVRGTLALSSAFASHQPLAIHLGPGETKRIDLREVLGSSSVGGVGGLSLLLPGEEPIFATQIIFDEVTGLAAMMKMFDRDPDDQSQSRVLRAPMMALSQPDPGLGFPAGTQLLPRIFLRNAGTAPTHVSATVDWRGQNSGTFAIPAFSLAPGEVRTISLADYQRPGQIPLDANWGMLNLAYTGRRADLVAVSVSYDKTNRYGLQTPFSEELSRLWVGGMWHVDPIHNTFITTGNAGKEPTAAEVTLFYNGGKSKYRMEKMLAPGEQLWLDLGHLVHDQVPDSDGNTLPPDTVTGSYELRDLDHPYVGHLYEGKLVVDKTYGHAAYGCGNCCGYNLPYFVTDPFGGPPNVDFTETVDSVEACGGGIVDVTGGGYGWGSTDTAVATLPSKVLHTVAVGTATGSANFLLEAEHPYPKCPTPIFGPTQGVTVTSCGDVRDQIIGEYITYGIAFTPVCSDFTQSAHSAYFTFAEISVTDDYTWALVRQPLIAAQSTGYGLDAWRTAYGGPRIINSGYRNPAHNAAVGGAPQSRHVYGDASDFGNQSGQTSEWQAMVNAAQTAHADYIEPSTGPCGYACTHADWRNHSGSYAP